VGRKEVAIDPTERGANPSSPLLVLVVEDDPTTITLLSRLLDREGCEVTTARNLTEAAAAMSAVVPDVAVVDVYLGEEDGLTFVRQLRARDPEIGIMVISAEDTDTLVRKAIDSGADNFLSKPIAPAALTLTVRKLGELRQRRRRAIELESQLKKSLLDTLFPEIVTHSDAMRAVLRLVEKVAPRDLTVLICGESGTGKDLVARAIHQLSPRGGKNFVELNCAALPASLVESELFGHEKGSFTGAVASHAGKIEQAAGGTLFLDEIGDLPLEIQPKLLRALQDKRITRVGGKTSLECDFRLLSATNRDLVKDVKAGRFREDLFYRIAVFPINLPSLRDRIEDLDLLLAYFLKQEGLKAPRITSGARQLLRSYRWPGNVRELKNFAQAVTLLIEDEFIGEESVRSYFDTRLDVVSPEEEANSLRLPAPASGNLPNGKHRSSRPVRKIAEIEREEIINALRYYQGRIGEAAQALGIGRATLYKYIKKHAIDARAFG